MEQRTLDALDNSFPGAAEHDSTTITDLFEIADLVDDIERRIRELAESTGMPALHLFVLEHLALNEGAASLGELITALNLPKQSATDVIDRLEDGGLVERRADKRDRRRFEVILTPTGQRRAKSDLGPFYGALLDAMQTVSKRDRVVLRRGLAAFRNALNASKLSTGDSTA